MAERGRGEVKALTGLRGVAALGVVGFHCHTIFPAGPLPAIFGWGFLGVDLFFILSGYVLASLNADLRPQGYGAFWLKRVCRIYPLHLTVMAGLAAVVGCAALLGVHAGRFYAAGSFLKVAALVNVYTGDHGWNDPSWSIAVEMACYAAFPFAVRPLGRIAAPGLVPLAAVLLGADALLVASAAVVDHGVVLVPIVGWVPLARGVLGFSTGCVLARLVAMDTFRRGRVCRLLASRPAHRLGEVSFSLYLLHQPIIEVLLKLDPLLVRHRLAVIETPVTLLVASGLACLTHAWVEVPGRRIPRWLLARMSPRAPVGRGEAVTGAAVDDASRPWSTSLRDG